MHTIQPRKPTHFKAILHFFFEVWFWAQNIPAAVTKLGVDFKHYKFPFLKSPLLESALSRARLKVNSNYVQYVSTSGISLICDLDAFYICYQGRQQGGNWGNFPGPHLARGPRWRPLIHYQKISKYSNRKSP